MYNELIIKTGTQRHKIFLQNGFYLPSVSTNHLHNHNYAEVHVVAGGNAVFSIDGNLYSASSGSLMIIPRGVFHYCASREKNAIHVAFQIDYDIREFSSYSISPDTLFDFFTEIEKCRTSQDYTKISAYIALFCSYFCSNEKISVQNITDYGFLIHEFFSTRYNENLHICDLANELHLSERQTERLVIKYTGKTFREELVTIRMNIAKKLLKSSNMSLKEISQHCGYNSYTGFWKVMKKYNL